MNQIFEPTQYSFFSTAECPLRYVIHHHDATRNHFDLRLQWCGRAQSWVIPQGPSLDPAVSREILRMPDHPIRCLETEGRIPAGNYGAGPMIMWDKGTYSVVEPKDVSPERAMEAGLAKGRVRLRFDGIKLNGDWLLIRRRGKWSFEKMVDAYASTSNVLLLDRSVLTGRRLVDL